MLGPQVWITPFKLLSRISVYAALSAGHAPTVKGDGADAFSLVPESRSPSRHDRRFPESAAKVHALKRALGPHLFTPTLAGDLAPAHDATPRLNARRRTTAT
jgi:hypothetical protein